MPVVPVPGRVQAVQEEVWLLEMVQDAGPGRAVADRLVPRKWWVEQWGWACLELEAVDSMKANASVNSVSQMNNEPQLIK